MENKSNLSTNDVVKIIAEGRNRTNLFKDSEQRFRTKIHCLYYDVPRIGRKTKLTSPNIFVLPRVRK